MTKSNMPEPACIHYAFVKSKHCCVLYCYSPVAENVVATLAVLEAGAESRNITAMLTVTTACYLDYRNVFS